MSMLASPSPEASASPVAELSEELLQQWSVELEQFISQTRWRLSRLAVTDSQVGPENVPATASLRASDESPVESQEDAMLRLQEIRERLAARLQGD